MGGVQFKQTSPDSLSPEEKIALQNLVENSGVAIGGKEGKFFIQTQELNPREIGPFSSMKEAEEFTGMNPDREKTVLRAV